MDHLIVTDIYAASEEPIEGISSEKLVSALEHPDKEYIASLDDVIPRLMPTLNDGDFVVCLGAGSIGTLPEKIITALEARHG